MHKGVSELAHCSDQQFNAPDAQLDGNTGGVSMHDQQLSLKELKTQEGWQLCIFTFKATDARVAALIGNCL